MKKRLLRTLAMSTLIALFCMGAAAAAEETADVYVGGVGLVSGQYLAAESRIADTTQPEGGYAYYKDGVLTLHNYVYEGDGYIFDENHIGPANAIIYSAQDSLTIELNGQNKLTSHSGSAIFAENGTLTIMNGYDDEEGVLNIGSYASGIHVVNGSLTIESGAYDITTYRNSIFTERSTCTINNGAFTMNALVSGIYAEDKPVVINDGIFEIQADEHALWGMRDDLIINGGSFVIGSAGNSVTTRFGDISITDGLFFINSGDDGMYTQNGNISISGGSLVISAFDDGIQSNSGNTTISDGNIEISTGSRDGIFVSDGNTYINGGTITIHANTNGMYTYHGDLIINGGVLDIGAGTGSGLKGSSDENAPGEGNIIINGGTVNVVSDEMQVAVSARGSSIQIDGAVSVKPEGYTLSTYVNDSGAVCETIYDAQQKIAAAIELSGPNAAPAEATVMAGTFTDVADDAWYKEAVDFAVQTKMMNGTSETEFSPNDTTGRAMFVAMLYRLDGSPSTSGVTAYTDVPENAYYHDAILWAYAHGVILGSDETEFHPSNPITREQLVTMLYNYMKAEDVYISEDQEIQLDEYVDEQDVSPWAREAFYYMTQNSIISGKPGNCLDPQGSASRAETAMILMRFAQAMTA